MSCAQLLAFSSFPILLFSTVYDLVNIRSFLHFSSSWHLWCDWPFLLFFNYSSSSTIWENNSKTEAIRRYWFPSSRHFSVHWQIWRTDGYKTNGEMERGEPRALTGKVFRINIRLPLFILLYYICIAIFKCIVNLHLFVFPSFCVFCFILLHFVSF